MLCIHNVDTLNICMKIFDTEKIFYCHYGIIIPQNISLNLNKADNDLPIFFTNSLVSWKVYSQLLKEPSSWLSISSFQSLMGDRLTKEV